MGHRLYDKASVGGLFDPLEDYQAPMRDPFYMASRCAPTADSAECTWYKCEAGEELKKRCDRCMSIWCVLLGYI